MFWCSVVMELFIYIFYFSKALGIKLSGVSFYVHIFLLKYGRQAADPPEVESFLLPMGVCNILGNVNSLPCQRKSKEVRKDIDEWEKNDRWERKLGHWYV